MGGAKKTDERIANLCIPADATVLDALRVIEKGAHSIAFVCNASGRVIGSLTDGDIRRVILGGASLESRCLLNAMHRDFVFVTPQTGRADVLDIMRARSINQVPVLDTDGYLCGLHTIVQMLSVAERLNPVFILAGGKGTRLGPLTQRVPKPMVTVAGRPILERLILHLMSCGLRHFYLSVNYLAHIIEEYFGDGSRLGCHIEYVHEDLPRGTGGPLSLLRPLPTLPMVVLNGDLVTQCDVGRMLDFHIAGGYAATFGVRPYDVQIPFGVATVDGTNLLELREKPTERILINVGLYILSPEVVSLVPDGEYPITDLFARCLRDGRPVGAHFVDEEWMDVGLPDELRRARGEA